MQSKWAFLSSLALALGTAVYGVNVSGQETTETPTDPAGGGYIDPAPAGSPSADQVPLDPASIPKFVDQLPIPPTYAPTVITSGGKVVRHEYEISVAHTKVQALPSGFPMTTVRAFGGPIKTSSPTLTPPFVRSVPGGTIEAVRNIPVLLKWRNNILDATFMPVDPTLHWANPRTLNSPEAPFTPFPPGYQDAQFPVPHVVHTHGLVVAPHMDGTAEEWFTPFAHRGPAFRTRDYFMPNEQPSTQLFYHDHVMGATRLGVYAGSVGAGYFIRDPNSPLDAASSPLPKGQYEIPLTVFDRSFFTDGELNFPRVSTNPANAYWQAGDGANVVLVNGKTWPNLNVERRQYRFRLLAAGNGRTWNFEFHNGGGGTGPQVPFTIIGSDGGYLPAPQTGQTQVILGITERADILVDFSQFAPGTEVFMTNAGSNLADVGSVMRFTVMDTPAVTPPVLDASLFPARTVLVDDTPVRFKTMMNHVDAAGNAQRSVDGLNFSAPATEFPVVGSTEIWNMANVGGGGHQMHIHLIEFQVIDRQAINSAAFLQRWNLLNGFRPVTRPIVVDPTPFLTGAVLPVPAYDTGWKDTARAPGNQVTRVRVRWAPQETPAAEVAKGQNKFVSFDPTVFPGDPHTGQGYVWHCHVLGHEDNDMMRKLPVVNLWKTTASYPVGTVIAHNDVNYRVRVAHSSSSQAPNTNFARWERVNNNDGNWQPQIIYAIGDRVLHQGLLYRALRVHQAQASPTPPNNPAQWESLPMTACGQLAQFCADNTGSQTGANCLAVGQAGVEATCLTSLATCLSVCDEVHATPCSGLCEAPVAFTVPDGTSFNSGSLGTAATCHETSSEILSGSCTNFSTSRKLFVNGQQLCDGGDDSWRYPLPTQRHHGYCVQTTSGNSSASFRAF